MSPPACAHLHVHSEYSLLDGACKVDALAARAAAFDQPAIGLTDHGVMNGAVELVQAAAKHGVRPVLGCEVYVVDDHRARPSGRFERNHLTLLASSDEGYRNLVKLSSAGFLHGLHRGKPSVDVELMAEYAPGVIALTGCLQSRFCQRLLDGRDADARAHARELIEVFGSEDVYFEVQKNGLAAQEKVNEGVVRVARELGRPLVATGDVHYLRREDYEHHTALLCVQTKSTIAQPKMTFDTNEFYLKSSEEMAAAFAEWPEALASTLEIAERCHVELELDRQLIPSYATPDGRPEREYLRELVFGGLALRYGDPLPAEVVERAEYELEVVERMGFSAYFLIVWDFVKYARDQGIAVGPGRGSAAGSIVAYALRITDLDPLRYDLLFERFLNPERVSMPDIDIDFSPKGREVVLRYVAEKYGRDRVAQIITFGQMAPRAASRDAARVLGHDYGVGDRVAKLIPEAVMGRSPSFESCLEPGTDLRQAYDEDPAVRQVVDTARGLEGIVRNASIHAAAVVISDRPLTDIVPLQLADANATDEQGNKVYRTVTQFAMGPVEQLGLLKMDFLGLRNLDVIEDALDIVERSTGERPDMAALPLDDDKTYEMLARGDAVGVFQFESEGMREALKKVRPTEFEDIVAVGGLYRPGAMDQIPAYARGKRNPESIVYPDERLRPIVESTKGVILYQEQAMRIAKELAGFSGAKADDLRKAIGKKNREKMAALKPDFVAGCQASGTAQSVIEMLWATNEKSADYSFNKCASGETRVILPDGARMRLSEAYRSQPDELMAMWSDGEVRPHRVARIVRTGRKPVVRVRCASGRQIKATLEHRLLTTAGYLSIAEMKVGTELITLPMISEKQREAGARMREWQASRSPEEKVARRRRVHALHPDMTRAGVAAMHDRVKWLWANDPAWRRSQVEKTLVGVRAAYDTGPGYGECSVATNGMWCASRPERQMAGWLIDHGVEFEMHKVLPDGRICDFYFDGRYWEMDGMDRTPGFFAEKYGDLPFTVVTPEDFEFVIENSWGYYVENGDPIVSIEPEGEEMTYDVEMAPDGPLNFIANGIVSHNSHAACYALISYQTAWLKANHPAEYMAALISSVMDTKDKVPFFVAQAEQMGIEILPPDVNESDHAFVVVEGRVRFGLDAVKGVGHAAVEAIKAARAEAGPFTSLWDFCARVDCRAVNKKAIEALVKCGAFGSTGASRKGMLTVLEAAQAAGNKSQLDAQIGQGSIFDLGGPATPAVARPTHPPIPSEEFDQAELLAVEKESIGLFVSAHPLKPIREALRMRSDCALAAVPERRDGEWVTVGGIITQAKKIPTKKGGKMMFATLDDLEGSVEILVFEKGLNAYEGELGADCVVLVRGRVDHKEPGKTCVVADRVEPFAPSEEEVAAAKAKAIAAAEPPKPFRVAFDAAHLPASVVEELKGLLSGFPGEAEVVLDVRTSSGPRKLRLGPSYRVAPSPGLRAELAQLLGPAMSELAA